MKRLSLISLITILALATPLALAAREINDPDITDAVEDELLFDPAVLLNNIDVVTADGVVTLKGTTDNILARRRAARLAETVKGVRSVINRIEVRAKKTRTDSEIRRDVSEALLTDPAAESYEVDVAVNDGKVTLTGQVESWQERSLSEKIAAGVKGVRAIENKIDVDYRTDRPAIEIAPEIEARLRWDALVDHGLIDVRVEDNGVVTLTGTVGSAAEKSRAVADAWVAGVTDVRASQLTVAKWARDEDIVANKYRALEADSIREAITDALLYDPRVKSFNVNVEVDGSLVTLRGTVDNLEAKRAAARVARNTVGVTGVTNRLKVRMEEPPSDRAIEDRIADVLIWDPYIDRTDVTIDVDDGVVTLTGVADTLYEKGHADEAVSGVQGVIEVNNNLAVAEAPKPLVYDPYVTGWNPYESEWYDYEPGVTYETDEEIREEINDELWWSPFVDSDEVTVTVEDGVATLTGMVDSWSEKRAATENAYEGGATWVHNNLGIETD